MGFVKFMSTTIGRLLRVVVGAALILLSLNTITGAAGVIIAIVGLVMFLAGLLNFCLIAPLFKAPFRGKDIK